ncbi:MBL fold metallo-hydrolase [Dokdonella sp.]|uniref:MBL fold metallo-hydrolase n=1 Tax=Dokdonella sp. TaxID=2291710 RepID=UPI002F41CF0C
MLRRIVSCLMAASLATAALAADELAPGVRLLPGRFVAGEQPDGNTLVFDGAGGLIVFDSGRHAAHTDAIIEYARERDLPITAIVNSHWHLDHVGGNARLRQAYPGVRVHASGAIEQAMRGFLAKYRAQIEQNLAAPGGDAAQKAALRDELALIDAGPALFPDERVTQGVERTLAGRRLQLGLETRAVTAGDVWLFDPATGTLAAGDLVTLPAPLFDTACPARWRTALGHLAKVDFVRIVPGHGAPLDRGQFATWRSAFDHLLACAAGKTAKAACVDGWMRDAHALIPASDEKLARGLLDYYIDNSLRVDRAKMRERCGA